MLLKTGANYNGGGAGEDFFYIQEVRSFPGSRRKRSEAYMSALLHLIDEEAVGR